MNIFGVINNLLFSKKNSRLESIDDETEYTPFIVNRWCSMHSPRVAKTCNIVSKYLGVLDKKEMHILQYSLYPKVPYKKIPYLKKVKDDKEIENLDNMARYHEISKREMKELLNGL